MRSRRARWTRRSPPVARSCCPTRRGGASRRADTAGFFWRKKRGKRQTQLAAGAGVSRNFLSDLERGKAKGDVAPRQARELPAIADR